MRGTTAALIKFTLHATHATRAHLQGSFLGWFTIDSWRVVQGLNPSLHKYFTSFNGKYQVATTTDNRCPESIPSSSLCLQDFRRLLWDIMHQAVGNKTLLYGSLGFRVKRWNLILFALINKSLHSKWFSLCCEVVSLMQTWISHKRQSLSGEIQALSYFILLQQKFSSFHPLKWMSWLQSI